MHRHGYKGRKFSREADQRRALIKGLATNLIDSGKITTTTPKAKELVPYFEKLITKAKKGDLHNRRQVISKVATIDSAHKLVDEIAPKLSNRESGHLRIEKQFNRRGDNAQMATVSFVDDITAATKDEPKKAAPKKSADAKDSKSEPATKPKASPAKPSAPKKTTATHTNKTVARAKGVTKGDR
jgi:large subunit ribosomal protein L17